jgi:predicted AlkP superfamily pyrophosphatase or phosphodiesterase
LRADRPRWRAVLAAALLAGCGAATGAPQGAAPTAPAARPYVILVSSDAFRHDYIARLHPPAIEGLAARGLRAEALIPSFPSKTFPNHYTIATGLYPGHHGIVGNSFYDPVRGQWYRSGDSLTVADGSWYGGEPIWVTAERNGVRSASYFWAGSEAAIGGVRPSISMRYDGSVPNARRIDESIGWLRRDPATRPHLVLLYLSDVDDTTHRFGPDAANTAHAVASVDRALRRLLDSVAVLPMRDSVNVVLVSDHGMAAVAPAHVIPVLDPLVAAGIDTAGIRLSDNGPSMSLWFGGDSARMRRAHAALAAALAASKAQVYSRSELPERWHLRDNPRAGDLLLVAPEGWVLERRASDKAPSAGAHGWDPAVSDMQGIFVAAGPGIRPAGVIPAFENIHIYPFIAALLRLERVPVVDGRLSVLRGYVLP